MTQAMEGTDYRCDICDGEGMFLGTFGVWDHWRCRQCASQYQTLVSDRVEQETDAGVCDDCLLPAYDQGIQGYAQQAEAMMHLGAMVEDHECIRIIEPELNERCDCPGHRR